MYKLYLDIMVLSDVTYVKILDTKQGSIICLDSRERRSAGIITGGHDDYHNGEKAASHNNPICIDIVSINTTVFIYAIIRL